MRALFTVTSRVVLGTILLLVLTNTADAQKLLGVKKVTDHTSEITVNATAEGTNVTFAGHQNQFTGVITGTLNGSNVKFYCIDLFTNVNPSEHPVYWDEGSTPSELTYILNNYYPVNVNAPGKLGTINQEAAAVQLAIWHFSDNLDPESIEDATIKARTKAIIADAVSNSGNVNPLQTLQIIPATQSVLQGSLASFKVKAVSNNNTPISGLTIQLSTTGGTLSTTSEVTAGFGETPNITLSNGSNEGTFVVTAKATVSIPQGTIYVAKVGPTTHQRIVLASPTTDKKEVSTTIIFSPKPSTCDLTRFTTFTQGGWGSPSNSTPGGIRDAHFTQVFPNGLIVGGNKTLKLTTAAAVAAYLPDGGTSVALTANYTNPTGKISVLAGQVVALTLNVAYSNAGFLGTTTYPLGNLIISSGTFTGKTVNQFLVIANNALGGGNTGYSLSAINDAATAINENFDNGTTNKNYLSCETPKASLGDKVWIDTNKNGIQDNNETGKSGVTVKLFTCNNVLVSTTTTDASGNYLFSNLTPGDYYVEFVKPANYVFTTKDTGADDVDSDVDVVSGKTICTTLSAGENDLTWDAGIYEQVASLGDKVWEDTNKNGIQETSENGIPGVTVKLYTCVGAEVATTTTDGNGYYLFSSLAPGSYYVQFEKPAGYLPTSKDAGADDLDSDADVTTGKTVCTELVANENDLTWDAGFYKVPIVKKADLKLEKSVSKSNPTCGENFYYTLKVTNLGPDAASDVVVNDLLPNGVVYNSSNASIGSYDNTTGVWAVGSLANGANATLTINVKVDCGNTNSTFDLGVARDFNLFVLENLEQHGTDTQGKLAVGNNAILSDYSVGDQLPANSGDVLVVGHNLSFTSGDVFGGNVVYGNATNLPDWSVSIAGTLTKGTPINFELAANYLRTLSTTLSGFSVNGTTTFEWGGLTLTGTNPSINVFYVKGSELSTCNDMQINVPVGSVVIVNIDGTNVSWESAGLEVHGTSITNVLYNFYQATKLTVSGIDIRGAVLAPFADLVYNSGVINGQVVVKSMKGDGQFNLSTFLGNIPVGKVITNIASVTSSTIDEVASNNSVSASFILSGSNSGNEATGVENESGLPKEFKLAQNYPNPFNPSTVIEFSIPVSGTYSLVVYDIIGQEVTTLVSGTMSAGYHRVNFDASRLASGMYIYRLVGNNVNITKKMLLTK